MTRWLPALLVAIGLTLGPAPAACADDYPHLQMGNPSRARGDPKDKDNYLIKQEFFALSYHDSWGTPNWVSRRLVKADLGDARRVPFFPDQTLPRGAFVHVRGTAT